MHRQCFGFFPSSSQSWDKSLSNGKQNIVAGDSICEIKRKSSGVSHTFHLYSSFVFHGGGFNPSCVAGDHVPILFEPFMEKRWICVCQLSYGMNVHFSQFFCRSRTYHKKIFDGKRPHFLRHFLFVEGMHFVGLLKIRSHLGQKFSCGNPYVDRKAQFFQNPVF